MLHLRAMGTPREITIDLLREAPLFSGLSEDELRAVAQWRGIERFEAREAVFREGDE